MALNPESIKPKAGLVLTGGGARAAYQVGVLKAVRELLPLPEKNPFPIVCGTSAGAVNAATLAVFADNFDAAVGRLLEVWENFHVHQVYRSDPVGIARVGLRWLAAITLLSRTSPVSLLDNSPLADVLARNLDFGRIQENIDNRHLYAVSITCSGYSSGQSVSFYQGGPDTEAWERTQRVGAAMPIRVEHLMASSALPFIFPAVKINREYFGDGSMRQIKVLVISPSQPIERMVVRHVRELPWTVRFLLRGIGAMNRNGSNLASYLLFESGYCRALIDLGYQDTMARRAEVLEFLSPRQ